MWDMTDTCVWYYSIRWRLLGILVTSKNGQISKTAGNLRTYTHNIYIYIYIYTYPYIYTQKHTNTPTHTFTCVYTCIYVYTCASNLMGTTKSDQPSKTAGLYIKTCSLLGRVQTAWDSRRVQTAGLCNVFIYAWHDSSICVTWLIHMCDMT